MFGKEISNLSKPLKPLKRNKNNSIHLQNNANLEAAIDHNSLNFGGSDPYLGSNPNFYSHSQQILGKNTQMEEEIDMHEEKNLNNPQMVSLYIKEILKYERENEVIIL